MTAPAGAVSFFAPSKASNAGSMRATSACSLATTSGAPGDNSAPRSFQNGDSPAGEKTIVVSVSGAAPSASESLAKPSSGSNNESARLNAAMHCWKKNGFFAATCTGIGCGAFRPNGTMSSLASASEPRNFSSHAPGSMPSSGIDSLASPRAGSCMENKCASLPESAATSSNSASRASGKSEISETNNEARLGPSQCKSAAVMPALAAWPPSCTTSTPEGICIAAECRSVRKRIRVEWPVVVSNASSSSACGSSDRSEAAMPSSASRRSFAWLVRFARYSIFPATVAMAARCEPPSAVIHESARSLARVSRDFPSSLPFIDTERSMTMSRSGALPSPMRGLVRASTAVRNASATNNSESRLRIRWNNELDAFCWKTCCHRKNAFTGWRRGRTLMK